MCVRTWAKKNIVKKTEEGRGGEEKEDARSFGKPRKDSPPLQSAQEKDRTKLSCEGIYPVSVYSQSVLSKGECVCVSVWMCVFDQA